MNSRRGYQAARSTIPHCFTPFAGPAPRLCSHSTLRSPGASATPWSRPTLPPQYHFCGAKPTGCSLIPAVHSPPPTGIGTSIVERGNPLVSPDAPPPRVRPSGTLCDSTRQHRQPSRILHRSPIAPDHPYQSRQVRAAQPAPPHRPASSREPTTRTRLATKALRLDGTASVQPHMPAPRAAVRTPPHRTARWTPLP